MLGQAFKIIVVLCVFVFFIQRLRMVSSCLSSICRSLFQDDKASVDRFRLGNWELAVIHKLCPVEPEQ